MQSGEQIESSVFENGGLKIDYTAGCTYPVSYTHLDVYKRQSSDSTCMGACNYNYQNADLSSVFF